MKLRTVNMKQYNERKYLIVDERGLPIPRLCEFTLTHLYGAEKTQENNANHLIHIERWAAMPGLTHQCLYFEQPHTFEQ
ncbi:hypothetical protein ACHMWS_18460, partial [Aeromonas caviae]|uniref:hypothetical protein n=1 Tax=Aeromonas caviae TaxID=648 RepID=UPI0037543361